MIIDILKFLLNTLNNLNNFTGENFSFFLISFFIIFYLLNFFPFPLILLNISAGFFFGPFGILLCVFICITNNITHKLITNYISEGLKKNKDNKYYKIIKKT